MFDRLKSTGRITHGLRRLITQQWNYCSSCDHLVLRGRPAFAGYDPAGEPLFVGSCCAHLLAELATPIYWSMGLDLAVPDEQPLWRYMDFPKFVAMLRHGGLYFPRADKLEDPFEGAVGLARREADWDRYYLSFLRGAVSTPPPGYPAPDMSPERIEAEAQRLLKDFKSGTSLVRMTLVSCWHANNGESEALWRLYCPPPTMGVALRTDVSRLWDATADDASAVVGKVHYLDFRRSFAVHGEERIFCKRMSLRHEQEVRVTLRNDRKAPAEGRVLKCDLARLVEEVVVSPFAPAWFGDVVSDVIGRFGYRLKVSRSELLDEPFY